MRPISAEEINIVTGDGLKPNSWLVKGKHDARGTSSTPRRRRLQIDIRSPNSCEHGFNVFPHDSRRTATATMTVRGFLEGRLHGDRLSRAADLSGKIGIFGTPWGPWRSRPRRSTRGSRPSAETLATSVQSSTTTEAHHQVAVPLPGRNRAARTYGRIQANDVSEAVRRSESRCSSSRREDSS
jgi:hypothetical protein